MLGLEIIDWVVIVLYCIGMIGVGFWAKSLINNMGDFFMAGRRFGKAMLIMHVFSSGTHSDQAVTVAKGAYKEGFSGIWYQLIWLFITPFYWLMSPIFRRARCLTTADIYERRYDTSIATLFSVMGIFTQMLTVGVVLFGSSKAITGVTGGAVDPRWVIISMTAVFMFYSSMGGLAADVVTDFFQGFFTIILSFLMIPFALSKVGWFSGLHEKISDPRLFQLTIPGGITMFFIVMVIFNNFVNIVAQPGFLQGNACGRTELEGRIGMTFGNVLKRVCTVGWMLIGVMGIILYPNLKDSDQVFGIAAHDLLPAGLIGLLVACIIASLMSSCDSLMVSGSALFTENIYRRFLKKEAGQRHYIMVARIASVMTVIGGVLVSFLLRDVIQGLKLFWSFPALIGISFWLGFLWRRANSAGAWASTIVSGIAFSILWKSGWLDDTGKYPWMILIYLGVGLIAGIVVSLLTPPPDKRKLDDFYLTLNTPVGEEDKLERAGVKIIYR